MKEAFLDLLLASGALEFGSFKTKSGRLSPYFINTGHFDHGSLLTEVAGCYANLMQAADSSGSWHLFGPAYKGIPLATSIAQELSRRTNRDVPFSFNRKELKDHGEGGHFVGRRVTAQSALTIVEDVMTGGTSVRECLELLKPTGAIVKSVIVGVDLEERGLDHRLAREALKEDFGIELHSILRFDEIVGLLWNKPRLGKLWIGDNTKQQIDVYRQTWR